RLRRKGFRVSLFVDPDASVQDLETAVGVGADRAELFTGPYGACFGDPVLEKAELERLQETGLNAASLGLGVNAGHDLTVANLPALVAAVPALAEVSIGHGLTA